MTMSFAALTAVQVILPGLALTIAAMKLASGQMISGATRLIYGITRWGCSSSASVSA
jgi:uncharacterized membrane protein YjjP (DUF1212 family)